MSQGFLNMVSNLNRDGMYYNITKPKSDIHHWSDDTEKKPLEYWNTPKLWGDPKEKGTRFWNEQKQGEQNMSAMPTRKDQFGFGTEQPINVKDMLKMEQAKIDKLFSLGEINQEEYKRLYETLQDQIQQQEKPKGLIQKFIDRQTNIPYYNFQTGQEEIMEI